MTCNIDAKGRALRLISGIICFVAGIVLVVVAFAAVGPFWALLICGIAAMIAGAFQIYEGRTGWCALRAMGIKTPI